MINCTICGSDKIVETTYKVRFKYKLIKSRMFQCEDCKYGQTNDRQYIEAQSKYLEFLEKHHDCIEKIKKLLKLDTTYSGSMD